MRDFPPRKKYKSKKISWKLAEIVTKGRKKILKKFTKNSNILSSIFNLSGKEWLSSDLIGCLSRLGNENNWIIFFRCSTSLDNFLDECVKFMHRAEPKVSVWNSFQMFERSLSHLSATLFHISFKCSKLVPRNRYQLLQTVVFAPILVLSDFPLLFSRGISSLQWRPSLKPPLYRLGS